METALVKSKENALDTGILFNFFDSGFKKKERVLNIRVLNISEINKTIRLLTEHITAAYQFNKADEIMEILHINPDGKIDPEFARIYKVLPGGLSVRPAQEMMFEIIEIFSEIFTVCLERNPAAKITREEIIALLYVARGAAEKVKGAAASAADSIQSAVEMAKNARNIRIMSDGGIEIA